MKSRLRGSCSGGALVVKENITSPCIDHKSEDCKEQSKSKSEQSNNNGQSVKVETMKSSGVPFLRVYVGSPLHHVFFKYLPFDSQLLFQIG